MRYSSSERRGSTPGRQRARAGLRLQRGAAALLAVACLGAAPRELPLVEAVRTGSAESVRALLDQRLDQGLDRQVDVNAAAADGTTALPWAVRGERASVVDMLIAAGADVTIANRYGATPLSLASLTGNAGVIEALLDAGADANEASLGGRTALMTAARTGVVDAVRVLLAHGAEVHATDDTHGQTALMWAAAEGNAGVVKALIRAGADIRASTERGFTAFLFAARAGRIAAARVLLAAGAGVDESLPNGVTPLLLAITNMNYELAALLLRAGADPQSDAVGWSALHQLSWSRRPPIGFNNPERLHRDDVSALGLARLLLAAGADPNARVRKDLQDVPRQRSTGGAGSTPLFLAARTGDVDLMRVLLEFGADPFLPTAACRTPLMAAAGVGVSPGADPGSNEEALEAFSLLLELGGDISAADAGGETPLHGAAERGANEIVQLLVDRGADLEAVNERGWTPLTIAEGVVRGVVFKQQPHTAALLRRLMEARGLGAAAAAGACPTCDEDDFDPYNPPVRQPCAID
ncbi:MAG: ankyrin repeat domain-containing protein [Acidobacteria bacterium]|nr:ankyrin repeat domain-containing protein [Acidobacteriota bacterium]